MEDWRSKSMGPTGVLMLFVMLSFAKLLSFAFVMEELNRSALP
jgi:hypothetical protein